MLFDCSGFCRELLQDRNGVDRSERRMIPEKMVRIDVDLANDAAHSQLHDAPIVSRRASASALPTVHPFPALGVFVRNENSAAGLEQIFLLRKKFVIRGKCDATGPGCGKIDQTDGHSWLWISKTHPRVALTSAISAVTPRRNEERHMIFRGSVRECESHRDAIEKFLFAKIIAYHKNELLRSSQHFLIREERRIESA